MPAVHTAPAEQGPSLSRGPAGGGPGAQLAHGLCPGAQAAWTEAPLGYHGPFPNNAPNLCPSVGDTGQPSLHLGASEEGRAQRAGGRRRPSTSGPTPESRAAPTLQTPEETGAGDTVTQDRRLRHPSRTAQTPPTPGRAPPKQAAWEAGGRQLPCPASVTPGGGGGEGRPTGRR